MRLARGRLFFALAMLLGLSVACADTPTVTSHPPNPDTYESFLEEIIPDDWKDLDIQRVDPGDEELPEEWIVFYREDGAPDSSRKAVIYRLITDTYQAVSDKTRSFVAYDLCFPYDISVCECDCKAERADLLSAYSGPELIVRSDCEERAGLRVYRLVIEMMEYDLVAYFDGDSIDIREGWVAIDNNTPGRTDLVSRCTYYPLEGVRPFTVEEKMSCSECEIAFPKGVPDDVLTSPYPEEVVMALYSQLQYTDTTKIQPYFADGVWDMMGGCDAGQCGCPVMASPVSRVLVISMSVAEAAQVQEVIYHTCDLDQAEPATDTALVTVEAVCEYGRGPSRVCAGASQAITVTWQLEWKGNGWRFIGPPIPVGEHE